VHKKVLALLLLVAVSLEFSGCVNMSAQARRERAYRHYVQKQIKERRKATARAQKAANRELKLRMKSAQPSDPAITTSVEPTPNAWSEPVEPTVTVSASDAIAAKTPDETSQP